MRAFRVDPMAARLWQSCVRRLTTQGHKPQHNVSKLLNEWNFWNSERIYLRGSGGLGGRTRAAGSESWIQSRISNVGVGAGSSCGRTFTGEELTGVKDIGRRIVSPFSRWASAMQNSNLSSNPQDASEDHPPDNVAPEADGEKREVEEFVPEYLNTPTTPLVQAIRDAEDDGLSECQSPGSGASFEEIPPSDRAIDPLRVYVGGLPFATKGDELKEALRELFGKFGVVTDVELSKHRNQSKKSIDEGKHRGFAFVTMSSPEESRAVIEKLNGETLLGRTITVCFGLMRVEPDPSARRLSVNNAEMLARCKVFVGNLHGDTTLETLENRFKQFGTIVRAKLISDLATKKSRGFGFVTFSNEDEAMKAILDLDGSILDGSVIRVNIAKYPQNV